MATLIKYKIYCETESKWKDWILTGNDPAPTTCPTDTGHSCTPSSVSVIPLNEERESVGKVPIFEQGLRLGEPSSESFTLVTHDFTDRTSWYQNSVQMENQVLNEVDGLSFQAPEGARHWVNINSPKLTLDYKKVPEADGTLTNLSLRDVHIFVDGGEVPSTDYTIDFPTGMVTFTNSQAGKAVTATYWHNDGVPNVSDYVLCPPPGYMYRMEHVELQFSKGTTFNNPVGFEIWAGAPLFPDLPPRYGYFDSSLFDMGFGQSRTLYRNIRDLINWCNNQYPTIPACGDLTDEVLVFPFRFLVVPQIKSSEGTMIRVFLRDNIPLTTCEIATATFYMEKVLES